MAIVASGAGEGPALDVLLDDGAVDAPPGGRRREHRPAHAKGSDVDLRHRLRSDQRRIQRRAIGGQHQVVRQQPDLESSCTSPDAASIRATVLEPAWLTNTRSAGGPDGGEAAQAVAQATATQLIAMTVAPAVPFPAHPIRRPVVGSHRIADEVQVLGTVGGIFYPTCSTAMAKDPVITDRRRPAGVEPPYSSPAYRSSVLRAPHRAPLRIPYGPAELSGPPASALVGRSPHHQPADLTRQHAGAPQGERIIVHGLVTDAADRPMPDVLVEIWQTNAAGRYAHEWDAHKAPLDPNFTGVGWCLTDAHGRYRFVTIKPGAYPWKNHPNAWRPAHVHFSVLGRAFSQRLITQMYFPGDPLLELDPIYRSIPDEKARARLVARFDLAATEPEWALGYGFDIVLSGRQVMPASATPRPT